MNYARAAALMLPAACAVTIAACASYPAPHERMATSEAALRSAQEVGAQTQPQAQLHAKLAQEEITSAKTAMSNGDSKRADYRRTESRVSGARSESGAGVRGGGAAAV
jgi:hypothetical protein